MERSSLGRRRHGVLWETKKAVSYTHLDVYKRQAGPLTVLTGGELEAAFKSADKVVESRIDFVEDTLNEQGQAIAEKAPISHSSDKSTCLLYTSRCV